MIVGAAPANVLWATGGVFAALGAASAIVFALTRALGEMDWSELVQRLRSWWAMAAVFALAIVVHPMVSVGFMGLVSFLALREFLSMVPTRRVDRRTLFWAYLAVPLQYLCVAQQWHGLFVAFIPIYVFAVVLFSMVLTGQTRGFIGAAGNVTCGLMLTVFNLSHAAWLLALPAGPNPNGGGAGLLLFLVLIAQFNDVAQYVCGKLFGRRKVVPKVSPGKTWAGLVGGVLASMAASMAIAPVLTPLDPWQAVAAGILIALAGFAGDVTLSAVKRDAGVKDSGGLIPGHGGVLDRVDSLIFGAPLFFYFLTFLHY